MIDNYETVVVVLKRKNEEKKEIINYHCQNRRKSERARKNTEHECSRCFHSLAIIGCEISSSKKNFSYTFTGNDDRVSVDSALKLTSFDLDQAVNEERRKTDNASVEIKYFALFFVFDIIIEIYVQYMPTGNLI